MNHTLFTGSGVALITPFNDQGIDFDKLGELIEWHIAEGTDALIVCGTTGEAPTMPINEHKQVIAYAVEKAKKRIPVIAGTGSNDTQHSIQTTQYAQSAGADGILSVVPYYNKTSQRGLIAHFTEIAKSTDLPIILYNVPSRTMLNMKPETVVTLSHIPNIVGIKECDFSHVGDLVHECAEDFAVYSGEDSNFLPLLAMGGKGLISVMANIIPKDTHNLYEFFVNGDHKKSLDLQLKTLDLIHCLFSEPSPVPIKQAMNLMGMNVGKCRLPLVDMSQTNLLRLEKVLQAYGLI